MNTQQSQQVVAADYDDGDCLYFEDCVPPGPHDQPLTWRQVETLLRSAPDWSLEGVALERVMAFKSFREAMAFVNRVADLAEAQGHHPDISVSYRTVRLSLTTHKIGGLSRNDFILAAKIDRMAAEGVRRS